MSFALKLTIRDRLLMANLGALLLVFAVVGAYWLARSYEQQQQFMLMRLDSEARIVADNVEAAVLFGDLDVIGEITQPLMQDPAVERVTVRSAEGSLLFEQVSGRDRPDAWLPDAIYPKSHGHAVHVAAKVLDGDMEIGQVEIEAVDDETHRALSDAAYLVLVVILAGPALGALLAIRFQRMILNPIRRISRVAREVISTGDYSGRIERYRDDEIGTLAEDVNRMLELIETREDYLEELVQQRTEELARRNGELERQTSLTRDALEAQRSAERRFQQLFIDAPIATAIVDADLRVQQFNAVFMKILGFASDHRRFDAFLARHSVEDFEDGFRKLAEDDRDKVEMKIDLIDIRGREISTITSIARYAGRDDESTGLIVQIIDVSEAERLARELEFQAQHDHLTQLPNRRFMKSHLETLLGAIDEVSHCHAICILDLDKFKAVNDTAGHLAGDRLLQDVAANLREVVADRGVVLRLGGDEFAVVLHDLPLDDHRSVTEAIRATIESIEFDWEGQIFRIGVSVGVRTFDDSAVSASALMKEADDACYVAKRMGRNRVIFAVPEAENDVQPEMSLAGL